MSAVPVSTPRIIRWKLFGINSVNALPAPAPDESSPHSLGAIAPKVRHLGIEVEDALELAEQTDDQATTDCGQNQTFPSSRHLRSHGLV